MRSDDKIAFVAVVLQETPGDVIWLEMDWFTWPGNEEQLEAIVFETFPNIYQGMWDYKLDSDIDWVEDEGYEDE